MKTWLEIMVEEDGTETHIYTNEDGEEFVRTIQKQKTRAKPLFVFLFALLLLGACGKAEIDPSFQTYVDNFNKDAEKYNRSERVQDISIQFGTTPEGKVGNCHNGNEIQVDKNNWQQHLTDIDRKILIYHELGHCVLKKGHIPGLAIMNATKIPSAVYLIDEHQYLAEFFSVSK